MIDLMPTSTTWGPIYYVCHDPPVTLYQSPDLARFLEECFKLAMPPNLSLVEDVIEDRIRQVWRTNPDLVSSEALPSIIDVAIRSFAANLGPGWLISDLRTAKPGDGFPGGNAIPPASSGGQVTCRCLLIKSRQKGACYQDCFISNLSLVMNWWPFRSKPQATRESSMMPLVPTPSRPSEPTSPKQELTSPKEPRLLLESVGLGSHVEAILGLAHPCLRLVAAWPGQPPAGRTKLGGCPDLPPKQAWPDVGGKPLSFIAQVDLDALAGLPGSEGLPQQGLLTFFYDAVEQPAGYDKEDVGSWRVIHVASTELLERPYPPDLADDGRFAEVRLSGESADSLPNPEAVGLLTPSLSEGELSHYEDVYWQLNESTTRIPKHQLLGHYEPITGGVLRDCHWYSPGRKDPRGTEMRNGAREWRLLLQIDSDDDAGMTWHDAGFIYFCVRNEDLRNGDFGKVWLCLEGC